jgi:hypothetical protein
MDFKKMYNNRVNNIAFMHYVENSHDGHTHLNDIDNDILDFLKNGHTTGLFDNTAIFLFSDHGSRFSDKKRAPTGYLEERLPFVSLYLPPKYRKKHEEKYNNLIKNSKTLTSPFDIYATVRELTCLDIFINSKENSYKRSISLLQPIPIDRSCEQIGISDHFCVCVKPWRKLNNKETVVSQVAEFSLSFMNSLISDVKHLCVKLKLKVIEMAEILERDNGKRLYRVQYRASPNNGIYEVLVHTGRNDRAEFTSDQYNIISRNDMSRIGKILF